MKILVINGANMNLLGKREPDIYGREDYAALCARIYAHAQSRGIAVECFQSNHEGAIIDAIQEADGMFDGIVINPGAYAHYSYAIRDAIKAITIPVVEVHISDIEKREEFRHLSVTAPVCIAQIRVTALRATPWASTCSRAQSSKSKNQGSRSPLGGRLPFCKAVFRNFSKYRLTFRRDGATLYLEIFLNTMNGVSGVGLSETMKALGDPVRREILNLLKGGRMTAGDIASRFDMTAATVSYHLAQLKKAGLIFESREKNFIYYSLNASVLEEVLLWLQDLKGEKEP